MSAFLALLLASQYPVPPPCTGADATPISVRDAARDPDAWLGRCIRLDGYVYANRFFEDVEGYYRFLGSDRADRPNDGWAGIYFEDRVQLEPRLRRGSLTGFLNDCRRNYEALARVSPNSIIMMVGYCHSWSGLNVQEAVFDSSGPAVFERQVGDDARLRFGDLRSEAEAGPVPHPVQLLEQRLLEGVRHGDGKALRELVSSWSEPEEDSGTTENIESYLLGQGGSPFASLRSPDHRPQVSYFQELSSLEDREDGLTGDWFICFCKEVDCSGRWPISSFDASGVPARPYLCLRAFNQQFAREAPNRLGLERRDFGLMEPEISGTARQ